MFVRVGRQWNIQAAASSLRSFVVSGLGFVPFIIASVMLLSNWVRVSSSPSLMTALSMCMRVSVHYIFNKSLCFSDDLRLSCATIGRPEISISVSMLTPLARVRSAVFFWQRFGARNLRTYRIHKPCIWCQSMGTCDSVRGRVHIFQAFQYIRIWT